MNQSATRSHSHRVGSLSLLSLVVMAFTLLTFVLPAAKGSDETPGQTPPVAEPEGPYQQCVCLARPELFWDFTRADLAPTLGELAVTTLTGQPVVENAGPSAPVFPLFNSTNPALRMDGLSFIRFDDPGDDSIVDFGNGEAIGIEAWVRIDSVSDGAQIYVIGKGRTQNPGQISNNQNYALRLRGIGGQAHISFLYHSANRPEQKNDDGTVTAEAYKGEFHRWNSTLGFEPDGLWHHVAVTYTFGSKQPPQGWIDGLASDGSWDMGGKTFHNPPIVDNDQVWIGSSMGGASSATFRGLMDEVAIFRRALTDREITERFQTTRPSSSIPELANDQIPADTVTFDIRENVSLKDTWSREGTRITMQWQQPVAAVVDVPKKYITGGIIGDRSNPSILRMRTRLKTPNLSTQVLMRSRSKARLLIDGKEVASMEQAKYATDGHGDVRQPIPLLYEHMHPVPTGDQELVTPIELTDGEHLFEMETIIGGSGMRVENSEIVLAMGSPDSEFKLISPVEHPIGLDERSWREFSSNQRQYVRHLEQQERQRRSTAADEYWQRRHQLARQLNHLSETSGTIDSSGIDQIITDVLKRQELQPLPIVDDLTFLRRVTLNTVGVVPSGDEVVWFLSQPAETRRSLAIDRFLADDRWADHWTAYWQDVLAENPGILKPELNNSGPFRWWIYESFLDNKPMDQFATELIMMKGSKLGGGPAGFAMASQNDVPFAERALVIAAAFNARDMKCARCHDSPVNEFSQQELFSVAAMINRGPIKLPATSTVPPGPDGERSELITVSLEPGAVIRPEWPFNIALNGPAAHGYSPDGDAVPLEALLQNPSDTRERAALHFTHPTQSAFDQVMVDRLWSRLFGTGLISNVEDWDGEQESELTDLLVELGRQHVAVGYDLKSTARIIMNTNAWQRAVAPADSPLARFFGGQTNRRLTAEQMVDSLYFVVGKTFDSEMLTLDSEGRRPASSFLNLGAPTRAWQFCSLSNERDRPALALPRAQAIYDLLTVFGWRDSRPQSINNRPEEATVLQPLTLSNGTAGRRLIQLSDGAIATELAVNAKSPEELAVQLFQQVLSRTPDSEEELAFANELREGFEDRLIADAVVPEQPKVIRDPISWSNHLHPHATEIKQQIEAVVRAGDPPSVRLKTEWRLRAEDALWVLLNCPEFAFVP
ncbi:MAG: DUF1549 domain-containing protein [Planctomycetaceae bacterium]